METTLSSTQPDNEHWKSQVIPGCYVLCFLPATLGTVYAAVKPAPARDQTKGLVLLNIYCKDVVMGEPLLMSAQSMEMPLSKEQFDLAASLGWPDDEYGIMRIFNVKPN